MNNVIITLLYASVVIGWAVSIRVRIYNKKVRGYLMAVCLMMLLFFMLKLSNYVFFLELPDAQRYVWYMYYIPLTVMPLLTFFSASQVRWDVTGERSVSEYLRAFFIFLVTVLIMMFLTNDYHRLAFRFPENEMHVESDYSRGIIYYISVLWIIIMLAGSLWELIKGCRMSRFRRQFLIPLIPLMIAGVYTVWYIFSGQIKVLGIIIAPVEVFCFAVLIMWEICIRIGLLNENIILSSRKILEEKRQSLIRDNRLYDMLANKLSPWMIRTEKILSRMKAQDSISEELIFPAIIYSAYIKRAGNLFLIGGSNDEMSLGELILSIKESLGYLREFGFKTDIYYDDTESADMDRYYPSAVIIAAYDRFEELLEEKMDNSCDHYFVRIKADRDIDIRFGETTHVSI